jgi:polar amino acid transport system permease protein
MEECIKPNGSIYERLKQRVFLFRSPWLDIVQYVVLVAAVIAFLAVSTSSLGYYWQWYRIPQYLLTSENGHLVAGLLIQGLVFTFYISGVSLVLAMAIGLATALGRLSDSFMTQAVTRTYLEVIRNTPLLVQIYLVYFVIGPIIGLGRFGSGVLALSLFEGSYMSEIFRAGIVSLHKGQWEASYSLGLSTFDTYRDVILPQAIRRISPPLVGEVISLIKNSALVSLVSLSDLAMQARSIAADTLLTFEVWFTTAAIYLVVTITLSVIVGQMEKKFRILT